LQNLALPHRLPHKEKREKRLITNNRNETEDITSDAADIKDGKGIL